MGGRASLGTVVSSASGQGRLREGWAYGRGGAGASGPHPSFRLTGTRNGVVVGVGLVKLAS